MILIANFQCYFLVKYGYVMDLMYTTVLIKLKIDLNLVNGEIWVMSAGFSRSARKKDLVWIGGLMRTSYPSIDRFIKHSSTHVNPRGFTSIRSGQYRSLIWLFRATFFQGVNGVVADSQSNSLFA